MGDFYNSNKSIRPYITGAVIGILGYILLPTITNNLSSCNSPKKEEILSVIENTIQSDRIKTEMQMQNLEGRLNNLVMEIQSSKNQQGNYNNYQNPTEEANKYLNQFVDDKNYSQNSTYPSYSNTQLPNNNTTNSYPSHDIYFSWQANDRGIANSKRSYQISVNTSKIMENMQKFGEWFKNIVRR